jgi:hypothetical protein
MVSRFSTCIAIACASLATSTARAQEYSCDFSSGVGRATPYGTAVLDGGSLRLTEGVPNQNGALLLNTYAEGAKAFDATFDFTFHSAAPPFYLHLGMSFNLGVLPDGVIPFNAHLGPGNGLTIDFHLSDFDGSGIGGDCGIRVYYNGAIIASVPDAIIADRDNHVARPVHVYLDYSGELTVTYNGAPVVTKLVTGFVPQPGQRFGFAGVTPSWDSVGTVIDNVVVRPYFKQGSCTNAAPIVGDGIWGFSYDDAASITEGAASCAATTRDVWFCWKALADGVATISTVNLTDDDSVLTVFDGCYPFPGGFGELACDDDAHSGINDTASQVMVNVKAGGTYGIRIATYGDIPSDAWGLEGMSVSTKADCPADFDHSGTKSVQDIFDFLNAWFARCP